MHHCHLLPHVLLTGCCTCCHPDTHTHHTHAHTHTHRERDTHRTQTAAGDISRCTTCITVIYFSTPCWPAAALAATLAHTQHTHSTHTAAGDFTTSAGARLASLSFTSARLADRLLHLLPRRHTHHTRTHTHTHTNTAHTQHTNSSR